MKKLFKIIKSLFKSDKNRCLIDYAIKLNMMYEVIFNQVRLDYCYY